MPPDIPRQQEFQALLLYLWGQCTAWSPAGDAGRIKHHIEATAVWAASIFPVSGVIPPNPSPWLSLSHRRPALPGSIPEPASRLRQRQSAGADPGQAAGLLRA